MKQQLEQQQSNNSLNLYEQDFQLWIEQTINSLETKQFNSLDIENLIEELKELGKSEKRALESNLMVLLAHLLKLMVQHDAPDSMTQSWYRSIIEHRQRILIALKNTPSLKSYLETALERAYPDGRNLAIQEGKKASFGVRIPPENEYPNICPFSLEQILDQDFFNLPNE
ncbi:MAG: DUF29 domain-containing protein [Sphaerospermopsis sp.]|uniref:DUF29 domain-containing protein n=1 Tax=Sphaerospermopsis sp. LEGE 00249 TaxID=1380707 RepID=UPI00164E5B76|nr:DUF29 domain-containing protein [Sphaerospermopsis sp. LEGE 00249]MEB3148953.1 DUF29 domain-containing protein [Sphaerospermopsis sp.]